MRSLATAFLAVACLVLGTALLRADSLYVGAPDASGSVRAPTSYFSDPKARTVGDLLTVIVTETASATSAAATSGSKSESASFGPGQGDILRLIRTFGLSGNEASSATGATNRADTLSATIAVTVKQVLPNGDLVVEGSRTVGVNAEAQTVTLTGTVRPIDIAQNNTIASPLVANAQIRYSGRGPVGEIQHDGLVRTIFRFLF